MTARSQIYAIDCEVMQTAYSGGSHAETSARVDGISGGPGNIPRVNLVYNFNFNGAFQSKGRKGIANREASVGFLDSTLELSRRSSAKQNHIKLGRQQQNTEHNVYQPQPGGGIIGELKGDVADVAIIGGGIVGLATAREIVQRFPKATVCLVGKEKHLVEHQTSHNSGVIHAGIYYAPGSQMAKLCVEGNRRMYEYCYAKDLPCKRVGKLIVATRESELPDLKDLYSRATANCVQGLELLSPKQVKDLEPSVRCLRALHSPNTGIPDYAKVELSFADDFLASGRGQIRTGFNVTGIEADQNKGVEVHARTGETVKARWLITCFGLQADYVGHMAGGAKGPTVLPFRGTYHELRPEYPYVVTRNIYPVPDPKFPMVGVHLTPRVDGRVLIGPNSELALAKEGYKFWSFNIKDSIKFGLNFGLWKLVLGNPGIVLQEVWRDVNTRAFVREARRYCPELDVAHTTTGWAGAHAVALDNSGKIIGYFLFDERKAGVVLNVRNAPSPPCTSSLSMSTTVVDKQSKNLGGIQTNFGPSVSVADNELYKHSATSP